MAESEEKLPKLPSWDDMTIEDMPNEDMGMVAEALGVDIAIDIMKKLGGISINIPKNGLAKLLDNYVKEYYDGKNVKKLALRCGYTERRVFQIIESRHKK